MIAKFGFSTDCDSDDDDDDDDDDGDDTQVVQIFKKSPTKLYCTFFQYFQQAFYKLLIMTRNFQSKFTTVTEGLLDVNFFCLETCSRKRLSFLIPTPIRIVTDIERAMQSILQFSWIQKLQL